MSVKKTLAIVGATENEGEKLSNLFAKANYRLLLISNETKKVARLVERIKLISANDDIDTQECVKDGCWEADVIFITVPCNDKKSVAELMKEVATQKIVVSISDELNSIEELQKSLPYSKIVSASLITDIKEVDLRGNDKEAEEEIASIFSDAGYIVKQLDTFSNN